MMQVTLAQREKTGDGMIRCIRRELKTYFMNSWDQMEGENDQSYAKFLCFKDLGISRSVSAAEAISKNQQKKAQASGSWNALAKKHNWADRCSEYDKQIALKKTKTNEDMLLSIKNNYLRACEMLSGIVADGMQERNIDELEKITPFLLTFVGKGQAFKTMIDIYETLFGKKNYQPEHQISSKVVRLEFD